MLRKRCRCAASVADQPPGRCLQLGLGTLSRRRVTWSVAQFLSEALFESSDLRRDKVHRRLEIAQIELCLEIAQLGFTIAVARRRERPRSAAIHWALSDCAGSPD